MLITGLEQFEIDQIEAITLGVKCKRCGHTWGIRLNGKTDLTQIPFNYLICENCVRKANIGLIKEEIAPAVVQ
jgi:hypothetical protein